MAPPHERNAHLDYLAKERTAKFPSASRGTASFAFNCISKTTRQRHTPPHPTPDVPIHIRSVSALPAPLLAITFSHLTPHKPVAHSEWHRPCPASHLSAASEGRQGDEARRGGPGTWSGMALRVSQCVFAAASAAAMSSAFGSLNYSAYFYLDTALTLQFLWSMGFACRDIFALRNKKDLHTAPELILIFNIGDWVLAILMFWASCAAASVTIFFRKDVKFCAEYWRLPCTQFELSVALAFITWLLQAVSSFSGFWLLVSLL
nr:CASP-like protein 5B3 [Aegilops tauschii subsp. strangulata]